MANLPTPEEVGKFILGIYRKDKLRPGETVLIQRATFFGFKEGYRNEDIFNGYQWCVENQYLEKRGKDYLLTEQGFKFE